MTDLRNFIESITPATFFTLETRKPIAFLKGTKKNPAEIPAEIAGAEKVTRFHNCRTGCNTGNTKAWQDATGKSADELGSVPAWARYISAKFWEKVSDGSLLLRVNCMHGMRVEKFAILPNGEEMPFFHFLEIYGAYVTAAEKPNPNAEKPAFMCIGLENISKITSGGETWAAA